MELKRPSLSEEWLNAQASLNIRSLKRLSPLQFEQLRTIINEKSDTRKRTEKFYSKS